MGFLDKLTKRGVTNVDGEDDDDDLDLEDEAGSVDPESEAGGLKAGLLGRLRGPRNFRRSNDDGEDDDDLALDDELESVDSKPDTGGLKAGLLGRLHGLRNFRKSNDDSDDDDDMDPKDLVVEEDEVSDAGSGQGWKARSKNVVDGGARSRWGNSGSQGPSSHRGLGPREFTSCDLRITAGYACVQAIMRSGRAT